MAKVDGSLGSLVQGVSQQPSRARLAGQAEEQINVTNDEVFGLSRRPSSNVVAKIDAMPLDTDGLSVTEHGVFTDGSIQMQYVMRVGAEPKISFVREGVVKEVTISAAAATYLQTDALLPVFGRSIVFKEMNNKIHVCNTQKVVAKDSAVPTNVITDGSVAYLRGSKYAATFILEFTSGATRHAVAYSTPDGTVGTDITSSTVGWVTDRIYNLMTTADAGGDTGSNASNPKIITNIDEFTKTPKFFYSTAGAQAWINTNFNVKIVNNHILIRPKVSTFSYAVTGIDTTGTDLFETVGKELSDAGLLPTRAHNGSVVRITASNRSEDDYFLRFNNGATLGTVYPVDGVWEETTAPGEPWQLDATTMPHELSWNGTTYAVVPSSWDGRQAGEDLSNPFPRFVGFTINDIIDMQGRATYLHGGEVSMSATDEYTRWFNQTSTAGLPTDPVHMRSTATKGDSTLIYGVPFQRDLVLFGTGNTQYLISGETTITPDSASMVVTSEFDADLSNRPQSIGDKIMFLSYSGKFTQLHEMFLRGNQQSHARRTDTDHVPRYMVGPASVFASSDGANSAGVVCDDKRKVYVYEFLWIDDKRVQAAWSEWIMPADVLHFSFKEGVITATMKTNDGEFIVCTMKTFRSDAPGLPFPLYLDMITDHTLTDEAVVTAIYAGHTLDDMVVVAADGAYAGHSLAILSTLQVPSGVDEFKIEITLKKNHTGDVFVGQRYLTRYVPTMPVLKDAEGVAVTGAALTVEGFNITHGLSGPFTMIRESVYEEPEDYWIQKFSGRTLGSPAFTLGSVPIDEGTLEAIFSDDVRYSKLAIECETHLPVTITEIEWHGHVRNRSRRLPNGG